MTEFLRQICSLIKTSLPLLRPVYRNRHDQIRLPFPQFFLRISIHCSGIKITVFSASIVLISGNRSSRYAIIDKNTSSLFIHMPVFLTVSAVFPCFYGFSTFITSGMTNRTKFFLAFRTDHPSLICQYFLTDRTASRVKNISNHVQKTFHFHFLPLFYSLFCYPLYFCFSHIIGINFFSVIIQSSDHSLQYHSSPSVLLSPVVSLSSLIRSSSALYLFCCFSLRIISAKVSSFPTTVTHFLALVTAV